MYLTLAYHARGRTSTGARFRRSGRVRATGATATREDQGAEAVPWGRLHLKIELVGGAPDLAKSDLVAGLPEADVDQVDLITVEGGHG